MANVHGVSCCGVKELADLQTAKTSKEAMLTFMATEGVSHFNFRRRTTAPKRMGQLFFTQADNVGERTKKNYGVNFAKFIQNQKLGEVVEAAKPAPNPNYPRGHMIRMWVWTPDPKRCWKWWQENKKKDEVKRLSVYW